MYKKGLIKSLANSSQVSQYKAKKFLKALQIVLTNELIKKEKVSIKNIGAFQVKIKSARTIKGLGHRSYQIPQRNTPSFTTSTNLKKAVRKKLIPILIEKSSENTNLPAQKPVPRRSFFAKIFGQKPQVNTPKPIPKPASKPVPASASKPEIKTIPKTIPKPQALNPTLDVKPIKPSAESYQYPIPRPNSTPILIEHKTKETKPVLEKVDNKKNQTEIESTPHLEAKIPEAMESAQRDIIRALQAPSPEKSDISYIDIKQKKISKEILAQIPEYIARLYQAIPIEEKDGKLMVAMVDPEDYQAIEFIKKKTKKEIKPFLATQNDIAYVLQQYSGLEAEVEKEIRKVRASEKLTKPKPTEENIAKSEAPTSRAVHSILKRAVLSDASDVHIEPYEKEVNIRFRIDGILQKVITLPLSVQPAVVARIKILSNMKIDETRLPQDGRFELPVDGRKVDFRVSVFPTVYGEKVVMRILDKSAGILSLEQLGVRGEAFDVLNDNIKKSHGMILVTGPTGSGKTTTLYAVLDKLNQVGVNIITLEDPVEYQIKGINQGQVRSDIGFSFADGLRSIVRQDPDIIMVGEIRDLETAEMAVHAALTGHVVLSTLHTNDAAGAVPRLIDMGIEPFLVTSSVNSVIAQRLTRKICEKCRVKTKVSDIVINEVKQEIARIPEKFKKGLEKKGLTFYGGKGCDACNNLGYKGRVGIFEIFAMSNTIQELILKKSSSSTLEEKAIAEGMITMKQDGILKILDGITTIEEVWRVTKE